MPLCSNPKLDTVFIWFMVILGVPLFLRTPNWLNDGPFFGWLSNPSIPGKLFTSAVRVISVNCFGGFRGWEKHKFFDKFFDWFIGESDQSLIIFVTQTKRKQICIYIYIKCLVRRGRRGSSWFVFLTKMPLSQHDTMGRTQNSCSFILHCSNFMQTNKYLAFQKRSPDDPNLVETAPSTALSPKSSPPAPASFPSADVNMFNPYEFFKSSSCRQDEPPIWKIRIKLEHFPK